jgi:hypothetical protein
LPVPRKERAGQAACRWAVAFQNIWEYIENENPKQNNNSIIPDNSDINIM